MQWRHWVVVLEEVSETVAVLEGCFTHVGKWCKKFSKLYLSLSHFKYIYAVNGLLEWFAVTPSSEMSFQNDIIICIYIYIYHNVPKIHRWCKRPLQILQSRQPLVHLQHFSLMSSKQNKTNRPWHTVHDNKPPCLPSRAKSSHGRVICTGLFVGWFNLDPFYTDPEIWLWDMFTPPHSPFLPVCF